ncbi:exonuclease domain-containing protein [Brevibacillus ruminantium]|uniref:Exonuclease domain-containing protein n=1 Tax=Brevibacillus ruminantium TaxID=2950604 RepID=A0ABY4WEU8_9BACL|nr:3'-5' exonuclease [Brevibacillus ruminantium]USG65264.1 exonuclease domain-containing protein [Brevibacillus ruminantium]
MNYILFDLEWNAVTKKHHCPEIIEIAAIKLKEVDGMLVSGETFHSFVRPCFPLSKRTKKLLPVKTPDTWLAGRFFKVLQRFHKWIGREPHVLVSWGPDDKDVFRKNCEFHRLDASWLERHVDFQRICMELFQFPKGQQIGLKKAVELIGSSFEGIHHSAKDDTRNTVRVFQAVYRKLTQNQNWLEEALQPVKKQKEEFTEEYVTKIHELINKRMHLRLGRKQLAASCGMSNKSLLKIENLVRVATEEQLHLLETELNKLHKQMKSDMQETGNLDCGFYCIKNMSDGKHTNLQESLKSIL